METIELKSFGELSKNLRLSKSLSLRELSRQADIPHSVISATENGYRSMSAPVAARLAKVLEVKEEIPFLLKAADTTKEHKVLPELNQYGSTILNAMALYLSAQHIRPEDIVKCELRNLPSEWDCTDTKGVVSFPAYLLVWLTDGHILVITMHGKYTVKENAEGANEQSK